MDQRIQDTLNFMEQHLNLALQLPDLAGVACLSIPQFHRLFKKETGKTPTAFFEQLKMAKAHQLLTNQAIMIHQLATDLGYKDYETFSRAFKKHYKISPDDLKAIVLKIKGVMPAEDTNRVIVATVDEAIDEEALVNLLQRTAEELNISDEDMKQVLYYQIIEKSNKPISKELLVKNKYELIETSPLWTSLIEQL